MSETAVRALRVLEIETFGHGGLNHYAYNLAGALAARGHEVHFATAAGFELADRPVPQGVRVHTPLRRLGRRFGGGWPAPLASLGTKAEALLDARTLVRLARRLAPDVIHLHNTNTSAVAFLGQLRRLGLPLVSTAHVVTPHERIPLQDAVYRRIHRLPDLVVAHSEIDRQRLRAEFAVEPERITVIPHGAYGFFAEVANAPDRAAARARLGLDPGSPVALFFGYLREYKGLDLLLDAWPRIREQVPDARLVIAGDPVRLPDERREALRRQAEGLGALARFEYIPFDEVAAYFAAADLLVLPYRHISQSGVLYLALALGLPVVATAVGAWPEMLEDGNSALLVPPGESDALADAVARGLGDRALRSRLAEGGLRVAEDHSWAAVAKKTESAFLALCARSAAGQLQ